MPTTGHGEALQRRFRIDDIPTLLSSIGGHNCVTFARIRRDLPEHGLTARVPAEDAYSVQVVLRPMPALEVTIEQRRRDIKSTAVGSLFLFNLHSPPTVCFHDPIDSFRFYIPAPALREAAEEDGVRHFSTLFLPELGSTDTLLQRLGAALIPAVGGESVPRLFVDHMAAATLAHLVHAYGRTSPFEMKHRGALAPWQLQRATDFLLDHLGHDPSLDQVAAQCALSRSHFTRRFKASTGCAPYQWLLERRMSAARRMLRNSEKSLHEIARACGFSSQSRFNKTFKRRTGTTPGAYRRER
jgi:AraC family transcriptional regulator